LLPPEEYNIVLWPIISKSAYFLPPTAYNFKSVNKSDNPYPLHFRERKEINSARMLTAISDGVLEIKRG